MASFQTVRWAVLAWCLATAAGAASAVVALPQYNIDTSKISVSGLSAGGFMANQLGYAHSDRFMGVGIFAGGPYMCAGHSNYTACMYNASVSSSQLNTLQNSINSFSAAGSIANKSHLAAQKIFIFTGSSDSTVGPNLTGALQTQYLNNGVPAAQIAYVQRSGTAHVFPTDFDSTGNNACSSTSSPYISNCGYDGAQAVLSHIYGPLAARNNSPAASNFIEFNQASYTGANPGMASTGWLYAPAACTAGTQCKLHVVLHGCQQSTDKIGDKYVKNTGYARWADTNNIVLLFPQAKVDNNSRSTAASSLLPNPNACWDWVGWYGNDFARKSGAQVSAIMAMVDRVASGTGSGPGGEGPGEGGSPGLTAPTGVTASGASASSMLLSWSAVAGADSYNVYRNGNKVNALGVYGTSYTDTGLAASTSYSWTVRAADATALEGPASAAVGGTTLAAPGGATCTTASNYAHTVAGRAYALYGYAYAVGSNQLMGLWNVFYSTTLKQTAPNHYVIGTCP